LPETCFTARPEIGVWGVATALDAGCGHAAAQAIADVLQNIRPAGTLTALVEEVRRMLETVQRQFASRSSIEAKTSIVASAVVFVTVGAECAVLRSGPAQAVRCRSSSITPICGIGRSDEQEIVQVEVSYESVLLADRWLISAAPVFDEQSLLELASAFNCEGEDALTLVRDICATEDASSVQLPVLLLTARAA
jgi:hypothetical protein